MSEAAEPKGVKIAKLPEEKSTAIGRMALAEVDAALLGCEKNIKTQIDTVRLKLNSNASLPPSVLRELSKGNSLKVRLMMRRIALLLESGDSTVMELLERLMKVKPVRPSPN